MDERQSQMLLALRQITENVSAQNSLEDAIALLVVSIRNATAADCCSLYFCKQQPALHRFFYDLMVSVFHSIHRKVLYW